MGCHVLLQGLFQIQGWNPCLLHQQADSLPLSHQGSPPFHIRDNDMGLAGLQVPYPCRLPSPSSSIVGRADLLPLRHQESTFSLRELSYLLICSISLAWSVHKTCANFKSQPKCCGKPYEASLSKQGKLEGFFFSVLLAWGPSILHFLFRLRACVLSHFSRV